MTEQTFAEAMAKLALQTGSELDALKIEAYWEPLSRIDDDIFIQGMKQLGESKDRFPTVHQIKVECGSLVFRRQQRARSRELLSCSSSDPDGSQSLRVRANDFLIRQKRRRPSLFQGIELVDLPATSADSTLGSSQ
jgi:hypothetical protein